MFKLNVDDRLSSWASLRAQLEDSEDPFQLTIEFWKDAPFIPFNRHIDPHNTKSWPTPWDIIVANQYDDLTKAIMIAYSLKFTQRFNNSVIEIRTVVDQTTERSYNIVCVDNHWALNFIETEVVDFEKIPGLFLVENVIPIGNLR